MTIVAVFRAEQYRLSMLAETAYGETPTLANIVNPIGLLKGYEPPDPEVEFLPFRKIGVADSRDVETFVQGKHTLRGNIPFVVQDPRIIAHALGTDTKTGTDPYTHTLTGKPTLPSYVLNVARLTTGANNDFNRMFSGCKVDSLVLAGEESGELKATVGSIAQYQTESNAADAPTVTGLTDEPYWFHQAVLTFWGSPIARIESFEFSIQNNLKPKRYYKTGSPAQPNTLSELLEGARKWSMKASIAIDDMSIYTKLKAGTPFDVSIVFTRGAGDTLTIDTDVTGGGDNNCVISKAPHNVPESDEVIVPVDIQIKKAKIVVVNSYATAYV